MSGDDQETGYGPPGTQGVSNDRGRGVSGEEAEIQGTPWTEAIPSDAIMRTDMPWTRADDWALDKPGVHQSWVQAQNEVGLSSIGRTLAGLIGFQTVVEQDPVTGMYSAQSRWGPNATGESWGGFLARSLANLNPVPGLSVGYRGNTGWGSRYGLDFDPLSAAVDVATMGLSKAGHAAIGGVNTARNAFGFDTKIQGPGASFGATPPPAIQELGALVASTDPDEVSVGPSSAAPAVASRGPAVQAVGTAPPSTWDGGETPLWWLKAAPRAA